MAIKHAFTSAKSDGGDSTLVKPSDWNADHTGGALSTEQFLVGTASAGLSAEKVKAALYKNYDPDEYPGSPNAENDEFDDGSVDAKWGWSSTAPTTDDETTFTGFAYIDSVSQSSAAVYKRQSYAPGASTAFTIVAKIAAATTWNGNQTYVAGLAALDSSDAEIANVATISDGNTSNLNGMRISGPNQAASLLTPLNFTDWFYLALARTTGNVYRGYWSLDGLIWNVVNSTGITSATTVARVGFKFQKSGTTDHNAMVADFFRRFATSTPPFIIGA